MNIRCSFWGALLVWVPSLMYANGKCAQFTFPGLDSDVLTAAENTTISLKFAIQELTPGCWKNSGSFNVEVRKGDTFILCSMRYYDGQFNPQDPCTATSERGVFQFTYTVNRTDDKQQLRWRTSIASVASDKYITFNITYPPVITSFSVGGEEAFKNIKEVSQGETSNVCCAWSLGNPRSAGIIYRYRNNENKRELSRTADSALTSLNHPMNAQCDDSGIYSCEVGDVSVNKTLLVKCPPTNLTALTEFRFEEGSSAELRFSVHSYTLTMISCRLEAVSSSMASTARNEYCNSSLNVIGSPPDLTVSVRLDNVRREDEGTWKLTLTNDNGTGEVEFDLAVIEPGQMTGDQTNQWVVFTAGGVGLALAVIAVIVVVIIVCRKTKGKAGTEAKVAWKGRSANERESEQPEMITYNLYGGSEDCTMIVNNVYQGSGGTPMTSGSTYEEVGSGRQEPKPSTSKQGVIVGDSEYAEVDQPVKKDKKKPKNSPGDSEYAEVDQPVKKDKKKPKNRNGGAENATGDMYMNATDIKKNKGKGKQLESRADNGGDAMGDMYVGANEVRAKKKEKKGHSGSHSQETAGADDGRHQNADGLTYVALDFGDRPATSRAAPPAAEETEYADISPNGPPPRPRR